MKRESLEMNTVLVSYLMLWYVHTWSTYYLEEHGSEDRLYLMLWYVHMVYILP